MPNNYRNEIRKRTVRTAPQVGPHHGEGPTDGAQRNSRIAAMVADRRAASAKARDQKIADRTAAAEKRRKETLAMAKEENVAEGRYSKTDTETLKGIHGRAHADISKPENRKLSYGKHAGFADRVDTEYEARRELKRRGVSVERPKHKSVIEETGTEARAKIKNVSRPDDAEPASKDSKLARTAEIKTKKIDEGRSMSINRNLGLPESLIAATRTILEKKDDDIKSIGKEKTAVDTKPETDDTVNDGDDSKDDKKKGKKKLDPVGKEDDDVDNDGDVDSSDKYLKNRRKAIGKAMKEEVEQIDEADLHKKVERLKNKGFKKVSTGNLGWTHYYEHPESGKTAKVEYGPQPNMIKSVKMSEEVEVNEILSKKAPAGEWIKDFVKSKNPKFAGKSPEKRKQMALAAYYAKQRNEEVEQVNERDETVEVSGGKHSADVIGKESGKKVKTFTRQEHGSDFYKKAVQHASGLNAEYKAEKKRMSEEVEQIDELKKTTLSSYVSKAADDATKHSYMAGKTGNIDTATKASKRIRGVAMAAKKLAKEEFSAEEIARLEEIAARVFEASYERDIQDHEPRIVSGTKGVKSKPFSKKFPHQKAMEKWMDSDDYDNHTVHRIERA